MIKIEQIQPPLKLPGLSSFTVSFDYDKRLVDTIKQVPNAIWHQKQSVWEIPLTSLSSAVTLLTNYDDVEVKLLYDDVYDGDVIYKLHEDSYKATLFKHQKEGIQYGLNHDRWLLLDAPGLGKTLQMIYLAEELKRKENIEHCFIICGINTLKHNWKNEINKFSNYECKILGERTNKKGKTKIGSVKDRVEDLKNPIEEFFVVTNIQTIRNEDIIKEINKKSSKNKFDMIIVDEVHTCKSPTSQQGKNLLKLKSKYMVGLTGTLLLNSPLDAYVPLKWIGVENSTYTNYKYYYCVYSGPFNNILNGYKNTDVLKDTLSQYSLRRTKDLLDLPEKTIIHEELEMEDEQATFYSNIVEGLVSEVDKVSINTSTLLSMVTRLRQATACPSILTTKNISSIKIDRAVDLIKQIITNGDKVVVFSVFKPTLSEISDKIRELNPLVCTGDMKESEISDNIYKFQNDDNYKVMCATTAKMGTGITLNRASYAIFIDCPWTSAQCTQCEDRIHRIGSKNSVFIYYLWAKDTIDERVKSIVEAKEAISDYIIDDEVSQNQVNELKKYIFSKKLLTLSLYSDIMKTIQERDVHNQ